MKIPLILSSSLIAIALTACSPQKPPEPPQPPKVTITYPKMMTVTNWDEYPGHIEAVEMVEVRPRVHGQIESIHFQDGAEVKAGDLLFVIDPRPYQAELERTQAECQRAETHLDLAKNDLKRAESLRNTKAISEEEYDSRSKAVREAGAALAAARAAEASAKLNLDYSRITAPISGKISRRFVTVGNLVQLQGSGGAATVLTTIVSMDPIYCNFDTDEAAFLKYRSSGGIGNGLGQKGDPLPCELALVNEQNYPRKGRVDFFDNQVNEKTGTIRLRGIFPNADRSMVPGMFATVRVPAGPPVQALAVPAVAVGSDQGMKYVLVVNKDNVVEPRPVEAGRQHGAMRIVTKGVTPEDRVIVNGLMMARPGVKVQIVDPAPNGAAPAPTAQR
ncbi:MAG: efflux RND transporter periplasmic adaptor subunit [Verrucomicrobia bacterium]|nr:efflux RND transporter periplasmic adaptor subunit [Verrucomicrobiota bacterium]